MSGRDIVEVARQGPGKRESSIGVPSGEPAAGSAFIEKLVEVAGVEPEL